MFTPRLLIAVLSTVPVAPALVACVGAKHDERPADSSAPASTVSTAAAVASAPSVPAPTPAPVSRRPEPAVPAARPRGCAGTMVNVMVNRAGASNDSTLRAISAELLAADRGSVTQVDLSPAIRTFRVHLTDSATAARVVTRLRAAAGVEHVSIDDCSLHIQRPSTSPSPPR